MCECWEHSSPDQDSVMNDAFGGKSIYIVPAKDAGENY